MCDAGNEAPSTCLLAIVDTEIKPIDDAVSNPVNDQNGKRFAVERISHRIQKERLQDTSRVRTVH